MDSLQIRIESDKLGAVMYLRGEVHIPTSPDLGDRQFETLRRQPPPQTITIDLAAVSYLDTFRSELRRGRGNSDGDICSINA